METKKVETKERERGKNVTSVMLSLLKMNTRCTPKVFKSLFSAKVCQVYGFDSSDYEMFARLLKKKGWKREDDAPPYIVLSHKKGVMERYAINIFPDPEYLFVVLKHCVPKEFGVQECIEYRNVLRVQLIKKEGIVCQ